MNCWLKKEKVYRREASSILCDYSPRPYYLAMHFDHDVFSEQGKILILVRRYVKLMF